MPAKSEKAPAVLIVEDEIIVAMQMKLVIESLGYDVIGIAVDRDSARRLAANNPDIVLVDCKLRDGLTGPAVGRELASDGKATVIYVTANPHYVSGEQYAHPAILGVYPKPVNDNDIGDLLNFAWQVRCGNAPAIAPPALRQIAI